MPAGPALTSQEGRWYLSGELTFDTVPGLLQASEQLFVPQGEALHLDFNRVRRVDSAAVALLLEWLRRGDQNQQSIYYYRLPIALRRLAEIGGVAPLLPIEGRE